MKNNNKNIYSSLLRNITPNQVDDLIFEEELKLKGYKFNYIVDPYDLQKYCYPFGITQNSIDKDVFRTELSDSDKLDEHIVFDILFQDLDKFLYILDQHIDELYDFQITVRDSALFGLKLIDTNKILLDKFNKVINFSESLNFFNNIEESELSLIVSIAIGYVRNGLKKLEKINKEEKRLIYDNTITSKGKLQKELVDLIRKTEPNGLSDDLMDHFRKIAQLQQKNELRQQNKIIHFQNDADVIDRIVSINSELIENKTKQLCLFLSSTDSSFSFFQYPIKDNNRISEQYFHIYNHIKDMLKPINSKIFNPHRTSSQMFLSFILDEKNKKNKISFLQEFRDSIAINFDIKRQNLKENFKDSIWIKRLKRFREKSENYGVLSQFMKYKETIVQAKENQTVKSYKSLHNTFVKLLKKESELNEFMKLRNENFRVFIYENSFKNSLDIGFKKLKKSLHDTSTEDINPFNKGKDKIQGKYHALPLLFFLKEKDVEEVLKYYIEFVLNPKHHIIDANSVFLFYKKWLRSTERLISNTVDERNEIHLLRCLILMLLPNVPNQNILVNNRLKEIIDYELESETYLKSEFYYLISWSARRTKEYKLARKFAVKGINEFPNDSRFYHSRALIDYCLLDTKNEKSRRISLKGIIRDCYKAIKLYKDIENRKCVDKLIVSLFNTIVYTKCMLWEVDFNEGIMSDYIFEIRDILVSEVKKDENYNHLLEFLHTEAYLELLESFYFFHKNDIELSVNKIKHSHNAIQKALKLDNRNTECLSLETRILKAANTTGL